MKIATNQERLNELFDADPRNDSAIAAELGVSKQTISAWRKGIRSPKKPMLIQIAEVYNVSIEWLMGYETEKGPEEPPDRPKTPEARLLAKGVDQMPQEQREQLLNVFRAIYPQYAGYFEEKEREQNHDD